jgi:hypothetical protein
VTRAFRRHHWQVREARQVVSNLLHGEISEMQARSIRYQMTIAKLRLPLASEIEEFGFDEAPVTRPRCATSLAGSVSSSSATWR